jgi:hypothetical protein
MQEVSTKIHLHENGITVGHRVLSTNEIGQDDVDKESADASNSVDTLHHQHHHNRWSFRATYK